MSAPSYAWCFCNSSREHIAEFDADMHVMRFRPATRDLRNEFKAFVLYRVGLRGAAVLPPGEGPDA